MKLSLLVANRMALQYFDELRGLLPYGGDSAKFDKNAILHHSIALIKQLLSELEQVEHGLLFVTQG